MCVMLRLISNALVNGLISVVGMLVVGMADGHALTSTMIIGATLTGLLVALKDIHSILQQPPVIGDGHAN